MKITINPFDRKSVDNAIKQLEQYKKDFLAKEELFVRRLGEIGVSVARAGFATADYDIDKGDIQVTLEQSGTSVAVVASGEKVGFIEFGTGVRYHEWDSAGMEYTPPKHGTYGSGRGASPHGWYFKQEMEYTPHPGWYFKQHDEAKAFHTYGNPPAEAMRTARDVMIERVIQIAREVWR